MVIYGRPFAVHVQGSRRNNLHDGTPLTSADIKYTLDRIRHEDSASPHKDNIAFIDEIKTPDENTLVLELGNPNAFVMGEMTDYHAKIVPDGITNDEITTGEHGSGPYTLQDTTRPNGRSWSATRITGAKTGHTPTR